MKDKNILIISPHYNWFVKCPTDIIAKYVNKVNILVRYNPFADLARFIPFCSYDNFTLKNKINLQNKPENVQATLSSILYLPTDKAYKSLGERHFKIVDSIIKKRNIEFDLVHAHFAWSGGYVGARIKEKYSVPFVLTAHGYDLYSLPFKDTVWRDKIRNVLNNADYIFTVSERNRDYIRELQVTKDVQLISNGFNNNMFYPRSKSKSRSELNLPSDREIILNVGHLLSYKGHKFLIESIQELRKTRPGILCIIVGGGHLKKKLSEQITAGKLQDNIMLAGARSFSEIPIWMNACDLFVLPSLEEGNPTVMFECLACGKPFVGTRVGGIPEIIRSDEYGFLCDPGDAGQLTENISMALDRKWNEQTILEYSLQFTWDRTAQEILSAYRQVLK